MPSSCRWSGRGPTADVRTQCRRGCGGSHPSKRSGASSLANTSGGVGPLEVSTWRRGPLACAPTRSCFGRAHQLISRVWSMAYSSVRLGPTWSCRRHCGRPGIPWCRTQPEGRDFTDLWTLSRKHGKAETISWAKQIDAGVNNQQIARAFGHLDRLSDEELPCAPPDRDRVRQWFEKWRSQVSLPPSE